MTDKGSWFPKQAADINNKLNIRATYGGEMASISNDAESLAHAIYIAYNDALGVTYATAVKRATLDMGIRKHKCFHDANVIATITARVEKSVKKYKRMQELNANNA